ncbi:hypothetical protein SKAU_G00233720 [Synaphobranchus kaupii]|uniref:Uncharacterized protein n=1 Tax=Synaphobranchus kaupii TaxID=118154 RepID=A0A9Q1ITM2_SYNKA|nr:hypothetical protein SKAU_G00233720 [Synaphobranchus kaupii]
MGDEEWMSRLRMFAALGVWPSEAGNRPAPRQKKCDTTTRTLILFSITRSNTWANTFQAHFDVGIVYKATVQPSGPSAVTTSSASALPLPTTLTTTVSAAAATAASGAHAITPAAPQQQLASLFVTCCIIKSVTTSSASALPLPTTLPATATTARPSGPPSMTPAAPEQQLAVDERSVPGMDRVDSLAEYLVGLRTETGQTLNNQQASTIIALWQNLLPYDQQRVAYAARHQPGPQHQYHLPRSTAGQAVVKRKSAALAQHPHPPPSVRPRLQAQRRLFPEQAPPPTFAPLPVVPDPTPVIGPFVFLTPQVPAAKLSAPAGPLVAPPPARRAYNRTVDQNKCVKCHQPSMAGNKETGHSQYYGHIYCPQNTDMPLDQWLEEMRRKRAENK